MDRLRQHVFEPYPELLVNERARSQIPGLGRTVPHALGNVLLTVWGSAIVLLVR
ncbi:hypothetical protein [Streptomyces sp. NPDC090054]|uniref:hypothetical protein n=1 Tax=Streptomyces sp. NPDC090054 TaxID=3365933 RepID=UPI00382BB7B8